MGCFQRFQKEKLHDLVVFFKILFLVLCIEWIAEGKSGSTETYEVVMVLVQVRDSDSLVLVMN